MTNPKKKMDDDESEEKMDDDESEEKMDDDEDKIEEKSVMSWFKQY